MFEQLEVRTTSHQCLIDITSQIQRSVDKAEVDGGICHLFVPHTTAGLTINENADPTVRADILQKLDEVVPWNDRYAHAEGNAAAHIKASLVGQSGWVIIAGGRLKLGTWQGIFLAEFDGPRTRNLWLKIIPG
jgi:secondary thiamine-phosphate synthase enzyme